MSEKRDLEFFMANPEQMPGNLDELEATLAGLDLPKLDGVEDDPVKQVEDSAAAGAKGDEKADKESGATAVTPEAQASKDAEPAGVVKSKDGKHEIPYSVLVTEREQRKAAEQAVEQLTARLSALQQTAKGGQPAAVKTDEPALSEEDLAQISADFPSVGKVVGALLGKINSLNSQLTDVRQAENQRRSGEVQTASTTVQEAIDNNGHLTYWQSKDPDMFGIAVQFDNQIKSDPRNKGLSLDERFAKVVKAVEAVYGETELPDEFRRAAPAPAVAAPTKAAAVKAPASNNVVAKAEAAIDAANKQPVVRSLSDIPGGVPPESDEITQLGMLSAHDLGNKFLSMDPAKIMKILALAA